LYFYSTSAKELENPFLISVNYPCQEDLYLNIPKNTDQVAWLEPMSDLQMQKLKIFLTNQLSPVKSSFYT
jgi:hypothetical protein